MINNYLQQMPMVPALNLERYKHFILDGTFLHRPHSLIALMEAQTHVLIAGRYDVPENSEPKLFRYLAGLQQAGLKPFSFTVDGNRTVMAVIRKLWPGVIVQRCLVHIQRQGLSWCRTSPRTVYARHLRKIFLQVTKIKTPMDRDAFLDAVIEWETKFGSYISSRYERGHVFSDIKRARSMLLRALPDMFHYLDHPLIPISTNSLEGYFSRLKGRYRQHRGIRKEKRINYFQWYFHFVSK
jgi:transposase-like protein